jgi:hypothetical protein
VLQQKSLFCSFFPQVNGVVVAGLSGAQRGCSQFLQENRLMPNNPRFVNLQNYTDGEHQAIINYHKANGSFTTGTNQEPHVHLRHGLCCS